MLSSKTILILSPQSWGKMLLSKHHYAIELARQGHRVFFLNPPDVGQSKQDVQITGSGFDNLYLIEHSIAFPYNLKFRWIRLFHFFMKRHIREVLTAMEKSPDIIWSFDLGWLYPFSLFPTECIRIFHPVDEPLTTTAIRAAEGADVIFSVTHEILEKYSHSPAPKHFVNHGISAHFLPPPAADRRDGTVHVGFSGNLMRTDIDRKTFLQIVAAHPDVVFDCFGSYEAKHSNIGGEEDVHTTEFINLLRQKSNVKLHGVVPSVELAVRYRDIDAWLICYDIEKDQSKGTNYHKVMEFISTGKVIVSNNITTYQSRPELVRMPSVRTHNDELPALFKDTINRLAFFNSAEAQQQRRAFAADNTYERQVQRICGILEKEVITIQKQSVK